MKALLLSLVIFSLSHSALADRGEYHYKKMCLNPDVVSAVGESGMCNIVTVPSANAMKGVCSGVLLGQIPCWVSYDTSPEATVGMRVICGELSKPILDQRMEIGASVYTVSALVKNNEGKSSIQKDPNTYGIVQSSLIGMAVTHTAQDVKSASIVFILNEKMNPMTNVVCK